MESTEEKENENLLFEALKSIAINNIDYFNTDDSTNGLRLHGAFLSITDHIEIAKKKYVHMKSFAAEYDFDEKTPGNGYRTFLKIFDSAIQHTLKTSRSVTENRSSLLFRKNIYTKEIEACSHLLASLLTFFDYLLEIHSWSVNGDLFPTINQTPEDIIKRAESMNQYPFYGRCLGFQYCESIKPVLKFIAISMASFSEVYYSTNGKFIKATNSMFTSGKYLLDPELRARRIVNISQNSSVDFCKSFWFLAETEVIYKLPKIVGFGIKVNQVFKLNPEPMQTRSVITNELIDIPIPKSHSGVGVIQARLISAHSRDGMVGAGKSNSENLPKSKGLIFHAHGGGFVAQSSKSHEIYLREWAVNLNVPILSIDYSLAPEAPYPRALEEMFYAYCWALNNVELLGTTGDRIIFAGDSAGANLSLTCLLKCIEMGVRKPDGIFIAYCPVLVSFDQSPSRSLCLMDPLLPFGFLMRCLKAYSNPEKIEENQKRLEELEEIKSAKAQCNEQLKKSVSLNAGGYSGVYNEEEEKDFMSMSDDDDKSDSFEEISVWEKQHTESDINNLQAHISLNSDHSTNDTLAGASFLTGTDFKDNTHNNNNTIEIISPLDSIAASLEDDILPVTIQKMPYSATPTNDFAEIDLPATGNNLKNQKYVEEFIEKYVLDTKVTDNGIEPILRPVSRTHSEENMVFDISRETLSVQNFQEKFQRITSSLVDAVSSTYHQITKTNRPINRNYSCDDATDLKANWEGGFVPKSPANEFLFTVPKDPFLSPSYAADDVLMQFPSIKILSLALDPCLDDSIMFAKKLRDLKVDIKLDVLEGLPHGFLNFSPYSKEAHDGSVICMKRIAELLEVKMDEDETKVKYFC
ncbi:unnamed protein product [Diamesa serratosioi]